MSTDRLGATQLGPRVLIALADECRLCVALDAVEGVYDARTQGPAPGQTSLPDGRTVRVLDWRTLTGACRRDPVTRQSLVVVKTPRGLVGLGVDDCLGIRSLSLSGIPLVPTRLRDDAGEPLCVVVAGEDGVHYLVDPRLLARAVSEPNADAHTERTAAATTEAAASWGAE